MIIDNNALVGLREDWIYTYYILMLHTTPSRLKFKLTLNQIRV